LSITALSDGAVATDAALAVPWAVIKVIFDADIFISPNVLERSV
jgi:hypothetical protein